MSLESWETVPAPAGDDDVMTFTAEVTLRRVRNDPRVPSDATYELWTIEAINDPKKQFGLLLPPTRDVALYRWDGKGPRP